MLACLHCAGWKSQSGVNVGAARHRRNCEGKKHLKVFFSFRKSSAFFLRYLGKSTYLHQKRTLRFFSTRKKTQVHRKALLKCHWNRRELKSTSQHFNICSASKIHKKNTSPMKNVRSRKTLLSTKKCARMCKTLGSFFHCKKIT